MAALGLSDADGFSGNGQGHKPEIVATYDYTDESGNLLFQVCRMMPKDFRQRRPDGCGGWLWSLDGTRRVLFRLPRILERDESAPVWIVEGEKDVLALERFGLHATCNPGGSGKWRPEYNDSLRDADVRIIPDNDKPGRAHAQDVARSLFGTAASVRIVSLPEAYNGQAVKDVSDFLNAGGSVEDLRRLAATVPVFDPAATPAVTTTDDSQDRPKTVRLADVTPQPIRWLWQPRIALGKLTLIAGDPGLGKSFLTLDIAARVTTGAAWPDNPLSNEYPGSVVLMNAEDDVADTIRPRFDAAGGDASKVSMLEGIERCGADGRRVHASVTLADLNAIETAIRDLPDCRLVVVDPVSAYLAGVDGHKNADTRALLAPLAALAGRYGVAVVMVTHLSKQAGCRALYRAMGSMAFVAAARAAYLVVEDKEDPQRRLLLPMKNNLGEDRTGLAYRLMDGRIEWEPGVVSTTADVALAAQADREGGRQAVGNNVAEWLRGLLESGPVPTQTVRTEAEAAGYAWRTVRRAVEDLVPVRAFKLPGQFCGPWYWRLDDPDLCQKHEGCHNA